MNFSDYIPRQKQSSFDNQFLNPFSSLLFKRDWKWAHPSSVTPKVKSSANHPVPSLKQEILLCIDHAAKILRWWQLCFLFQNLPSKDKVACTTIHNASFIENFIRLLPERRPKKTFNLKSGQELQMSGIEQQDPFFEVLLKQLRVAWMSSPVMYLSSAEVMDMRMLQWLNGVSNNKIFQFAQRSGEGDQNRLWFNGNSYHYLQNWLAHQFQQSIVKNYLNKNQHKYYLTNFRQFLREARRNNQVAFLSLTIPEVLKRSDQELANMRLRMKEEEEAFQNFKQEAILQNMEIVEQPKKSKRRRHKKKNVDEGKIGKDQKQLSPQPRIQTMRTDEDKRMSKDIKSEQTTHPEERPVSKTVKTVDQTADSPNIQSPIKDEIIIGSKPANHQNDSPTEKQEKRQKQKPSHCDCKAQPISRNLIYVSPKRTRSPEQIRAKTMLQEGDIKQKYSEQDKQSQIIIQDDQSSDKHFINGTIDSRENNGVNKRKRRKCKKQTEVFIESRKNVWRKLVNRQLDNLVDELGLETNALYESKIIAFERVRYFIQLMFASANTVLFGSNATGLSLPNSDVDILLVGLPCTDIQQIKDLLAEIAVQINAMGWVVSCSTYLYARVPLVKLQIDVSIPFVQTKRRQDLFTVYNPTALECLNLSNASGGKTISVDISVGQNDTAKSMTKQFSTGLQSTFLMKNWIDRIPGMQRILILLKYIMYIRGFNCNFNGGIGSYGLFVMVAAYMQTNPQVHAADSSTVFMGLLRWYGEEFDNLNNAVRLREEGSCFIKHNEVEIEQEKFRNNLLKLVDPITGQVMSGNRELYNNIKAEFKRITASLQNLQERVGEQLKESTANPIELGKLMLNKKGLQKWLGRFQNKKIGSVKSILLDRSL